MAIETLVGDQGGWYTRGDAPFVESDPGKDQSGVDARFKEIIAGIGPLAIGTVEAAAKATETYERDPNPSTIPGSEYWIG